MKETPQRTTAFTHTRCASAVAAVVTLLAASATHAQQQQQQQQQPDPTEPAVVVVSGTRASVASAIDRKKGAGTVTDSIVAEDIGQFPDKNVGEALSRVTGVQLTREFGEGSQVSIRGVEPDLNRIEINGLSVLGTNGTAGRGAELRELASELIKSIDVIKGTTADITEGGVGGTVQITTRKPLDFKEFTVAATLSGEKLSTREGVQPRASLFLADRYLGGRLGVMANLVYDNVLTRNDYVRNTSWRFIRDWDYSPEKTVISQDPALAGIDTAAGCSAPGLSAAQRTACQTQWFDYSPGIARYGIWTRDHKRASGEFTAQYKVSDDLNVFASYQTNRQDQRLNDRNYGTVFASATRLASSGNAPVYNNATATTTRNGTCVAAPTTSTPAGVVTANHYVTEYVVGNCLNVAGQGGQAAFSTSARDFRAKIDSAYTSAGFNFRRGQLDVEGLIAKSDSFNTDEGNNITLTQNAPGLKVSLDANGVPHFTFPAGYSPDNASSYVQAGLQYRPGETRNTEDQIKLDFKYRLTTPFFTKAWFGVQGRRSSSLGYNGGGYLASNGADLGSTADDINVVSANVTTNIHYDPLYKGTAQRAPDTQGTTASNTSNTYVNAAAMQAMVESMRGRSPGTFFDGAGGVGSLPTSWLSPVYANATQYFDTSKFNHDNLYYSLGSDGKVYPQIPAFGNRERIKSTYLRLDWETELFGRTIDGNIGGRYTHTDDTSIGSLRSRVRVENSPGSASYDDKIISNSATALSSSYHDFLPSFNAATWILPDTLVARVGWGKVMARPKISDLVPNAICTLDSGKTQFGGNGVDDCSAGNPNLKPYRATNKDLSLEYYPGKDSQLSLAYFRKDIRSFILSSQVVQGVNLFNDGVLWDVTQPINGEGATTKGLELTGRTALTFLPGWLGGFGVDANFTRMSYKYAAGQELLNLLDGSVLPYPGMSRNSYNVGLWYDRDQFNARIAYNYRDGFYTGTNDVSRNPTFGEKTGFLDAKFQYRYSEKVTFSVEAKNLTDEIQVTNAGQAFRMNEVAWSGRRYFVGVTFKN